MRTLLKTSLVAALVTAALAGCGSMSRQERNTATGAALGGVAGSAVTNGSTIGTLGGAAVGGAVGHNWDRNK